MPRRLRRLAGPLLAGLAVVAAATGAPAQTLAVSANPAAKVQGDLMALCLASGGTDDPATCACASEKLAGVIGAEAVRLYGRVGRQFIGDMADGRDMGLSWDMAIDLVSRDEGIARVALLERMNRAGRDHRIAIRQCREAG